MNIEKDLQLAVIKVIAQLYDAEVSPTQITLQKTKKEFAGHYTLVTFPLLKISRKKPEDTAEEIGEALLKDSTIIESFNVIKGFLNLSLSSAVWIKLMEEINSNPSYGIETPADDAPLYMVEIGRAHV